MGQRNKGTVTDEKKVRRQNTLCGTGLGARPGKGHLWISWQNVNHVTDQLTASYHI